MLNRTIHNPPPSTPRKVQIISTKPPRAASNTARMTQHSAARYATLTQTTMVGGVCDEAIHESTVLVAAASQDLAQKEVRHQENMANTYWSGRLRELGTILLNTLFLVKHPSTPTTFGLIPKAHFVDWFATTIPPNTYIFTSSSVQNTVTESLPLAAQRLRASDITVLLTGLSSATSEANAIVHELKVHEVITLLDRPGTQTAVGEDAFKYLKVLIDATLPQPVLESDNDKNFKAKVKKFHKRVMSTDVLTQIEKDWKDAFVKEQRHATAQYLIGEGVLVSTEKHNQDLKVLKQELDSQMKEQLESQMKEQKQELESQMKEQLESQTKEQKQEMDSQMK